MSDRIIDADDHTFATEIALSQKTVIVDFWAEWCGPCKSIAPILEAIAEEKSDQVQVIKVDVDKCPSVASAYGIRSIPTLMIFKEGEAKDTKIGSQSKGVLEAWVEKHLSA